MQKFLTIQTANALALGIHELAGDRPVIRDGNGVPVAWRLFAFGPFAITRNGQTLQGEFTPEAAAAIMEHYATKGTKIPLDSEHFLFRLAEQLGVGESEVAAALPDGRGTFGYAALELREDGLWVADVEYVPLARRLMAEGVFRYWSPVIRGLSDGRLRITSVAFTNSPAIDGMDSFAARAETDSPWASADALAASIDGMAPSNHSSETNKEPHRMNKLLASLASLLGMDSIALSDDQVPADVVAKIDALAEELPALRAASTGQAQFLAGVKDALALGAEPTLDQAKAAVLGLHAKAGQADQLKARVDALALDAETRKRDEIIAEGVAEGKLTKAMIDGYWGEQDAAALAAFLAVAPVVVPGGEIDRTQIRQPDAVALSSVDATVAKACGMDSAQVQEAWKKHQQATA